MSRKEQLLESVNRAAKQKYLCNSRDIIIQITAYDVIRKNFLRK
jgi:hypothetical protein